MIRNANHLRSRGTCSPPSTADRNKETAGLSTARADSRASPRTALKMTSAKGDYIAALEALLLPKSTPHFRPQLFSSPYS